MIFCVCCLKNYFLNLLIIIIITNFLLFVLGINNFDQLNNIQKININNKNKSKNVTFNYFHKNTNIFYNLNNKLQQKHQIRQHKKQRLNRREQLTNINLNSEQLTTSKIELNECENAYEKRISLNCRHHKMSKPCYDIFSDSSSKTNFFKLLTF